MTKHLLPALLALVLRPPHANAQLTPLQDPANLAGERVSPQDPADTLPLNHGAPALQQLLAKLRTRASLMLIVAHPDDEDGGLLTYESRGQGARVAMLTLTRGEGGQNLMSADFDDALGLIRTQELLAADRYFGVDQFFGTEVDFGFSKTKEESFAKWTHERVLYDAVRAVRLYRPLVIASVFVGGPTDGHGQHQVSGEIAQEVFLAAADPKVFPEMIAQGLLPWAPLKVYARVPFSRVTPEGMYDYATGKTVPTRFHNYVTGVDSTTVPTATVLIHEGDTPTDPTLAAAMGGDSYVQFARKGLALQKTQIGPNVRLAPPGRSDTGYTLMASRISCHLVRTGKSPQENTGRVLSAEESGCPSPGLPQSRDHDLFEDINVLLPESLSASYPEVEAHLQLPLRAIDRDVVDAQHFLDPAHIERTAPYLQDAFHVLNGLISEVEKTSFDETHKHDLLHELRIKLVQLNDALVLALNVKLEPMAKPLLGGAAQAYATANPFEYTNVKIVNNSSQPLTLVRLDSQESPQTAIPAGGRILPPGGSLFEETNNRYVVPPSPTRPYFSRPDIEQSFFDIVNPALRNAPATPPPLVSSALIRYEGAIFELRAIVPSQQIPYSAQAAEAVPAISVEVSPQIAMESTQTKRPMTLAVNMTSILPLANGALHLSVPSPWTITPTDVTFALSSVVPKKNVSFTLTPEGKLTPNRPYTVKIVASSAGLDYTESFRPVGYPGLPSTNFYTPATYRVTAVDVTTAPNLRIAYLPGTGDTVPDFLPNLGIIPTLLTLKDLTPQTLKQYDAVLLGVRAYAAHPELAGPGSQPLLDYAKQGGVVIAQYNTARYGDAEAPFPIEVPGDSAHNVVEEAQPVTLLQPANPLLTWPNKITSADFDHWVAERGHGFAASWSPNYTPLLETHDVGQDPQRGGLLLAYTGKGAYIYCSLALYRQLPEGVPGAYRLLANLLSYAKNPAFGR